MRNRRNLTWAVIVWNVLMLWWLIATLASTSDTCADDVYREACQSGANAGTAIGIGFIVFIAAAGNVILGVIWLVTGRNQNPTPPEPTRRCPHCAEPIQLAAKVCKHCGRDVPAGDLAPGACQNCGAPPAHPPTRTCTNCGAVKV